MIGVVAALLEACTTGHGQVVDAAILDGTAHLNAISGTLAHAGLAGPDRASGLLDGGTPSYDVYETADAGTSQSLPSSHSSPTELLERLDLTGTMPDRNGPSTYAEIRRLLSQTFARRTQAEWTAVFDGSDACVAPVLTPAEAREHPHLRVRGIYTERDGIVERAFAPRFSRTGSARAPIDPAQAAAPDTLNGPGRAGRLGPRRRRPDRRGHGRPPQIA